jgi:hypothetical protein
LEDCHTVTLVFSCSCSGTHNAQTLWNQNQSWMIP